MVCSTQEMFKYNFIGPSDEPWAASLGWGNSFVEHMKELKVVQAHIFVVEP